MKMKSKMDYLKIISALRLEKHVEGGYFFETFRSKKTLTDNNVKRNALTSIYYMITHKKPISHLISNKSDLVIYYHLGGPLKVILIKPDGNLEEHILGPDILNGHKLQLVTPANCWKCYELLDGEYNLIGEAVGPGFDYEDMQIIHTKQLIDKFPQHYTKMKKYLAGN